MRALRRILVAAVASRRDRGARGRGDDRPTRSGLPKSCDPDLAKPWDVYRTARCSAPMPPETRYSLSFARTSGETQVAVYERCGDDVEPDTVGPPANDFLVSLGLKVARRRHRDGRLAGRRRGGRSTYYSAVRPPGGAWGAPQVIVADRRSPTCSSRSATLARRSPSGRIRRRPGPGRRSGPPGARGARREDRRSARDLHGVAMSAAGDAIVLSPRQPRPGDPRRRYRPAGGSWGATQEVLENIYPDTIKSADGRIRRDSDSAVALADFREFVDTVRVNVRSAAGGAGARRTRSCDDRQFARRRAATSQPDALVRHPHGAVAAWMRQPTFTQFQLPRSSSRV